MGDPLALRPMPDQPFVTIPVTEEELEVQRRTVDARSAVRVRKVVVHEPVQVDLETVRESVEVERVPVGRVVDVAPSVRKEGDVTIIPVVEEREVVVRQLVLVEELRLTRKRESVPSTQEVVLRKERVDVERQDADGGPWRREGNEAS
jgi:stress response protein YsnF